MRQKGFTLIELLVALAVGGILIWGIVVTIHNVTWGTSRTNSQVVALTDVHQAALRLKKDLQMAQSADLPLDGTTVTLSPGGDTVTLEWFDYTSFVEEENKDHSSLYELSGNGELRRTYDETTSIVGRNITYVDITQDGRVIKVVITATEGDATPRRPVLNQSQRIVHCRFRIELHRLDLDLTGLDLGQVQNIVDQFQ